MSQFSFTYVWPTIGLVVVIGFGPVVPARAAPIEASSPPAILIAGRTCKQVDSCEEAVQIWCNGYRRADADNDGIPCENICHSLKQVNDIRARIGC